MLARAESVKVAHSRNETYEFITSAQGSFPEILFCIFLMFFFKAWRHGFLMVVKKAKIGFMICLCFFKCFFIA